MRYTWMYKATLLALMATAATACSDETTLPVPPETEAGTDGTNGPTLTITANQTEIPAAQTRMDYTETGTDGNKAMDVKWKTEDVIRLVKPTASFGSISTNGQKFTLKATDSEKATGSFTGTAHADWQNGDRIHAFFGTDQRYTVENGVISYYYNGQEVTSGKTSRLNQFSYMHATDTYQAGKTMNFNLKPVGALMKFELKLPTYSNRMTLSLSTLDGSAAFVSVYKEQLDGTPATHTYVNEIIHNVGYPSNTLIAYITMAPTNTLDGKTLILEATTDKGVSAKAILVGAPIEAGKYYTVKATLSSTPAPPLAGTGTAAKPYLIEGAQGLKLLSQLTNPPATGATTRAAATPLLSTEGMYFKQTEDISLADIENWTPIYDFRGVYDGDGHKITDLHCTTTNTSAGLFGAVNGDYGMAEPIAAIKNLHLEGDVKVIYNPALPLAAGTPLCAGGIVGELNQGTISGCTFKGSVTSESTGTFSFLSMGGIAGAAQANTNDILHGGTAGKTYITGCTNYATVTQGAHPANTSCLGGITGTQSRTHVSYMPGCINKGKIVNNQPGTGTSTTYYIGGIVGKNENTNEPAWVLACYNTAEVSITNTNAAYIGGIAGKMGESSVTSCYNVGAVTYPDQDPKGELHTGGLVGDGLNKDGVSRMPYSLWVKVDGSKPTHGCGDGNGTLTDPDKLSPPLASIDLLSTWNNLSILNEGIYLWRSDFQKCGFLYHFVAGSPTPVLAPGLPDEPTSGGVGQYEDGGDIESPDK